MPLSLSCPHCGHGIRLAEPYPLPNDPLRCPACTQQMAVAYPPKVLDRLRTRGKRFQAQDGSPLAGLPRRRPQVDPAAKAPAPQPPPAPVPQARRSPERVELPAPKPVEAAKTQAAPEPVEAPKPQAAPKPVDPPKPQAAPPKPVDPPKPTDPPKPKAAPPVAAPAPKPVAPDPAPQQPAPRRAEPLAPEPPARASAPAPKTPPAAKPEAPAAKAPQAKAPPKPSAPADVGKPAAPPLPARERKPAGPRKPPAPPRAHRADPASPPAPKRSWPVTILKVGVAGVAAAVVLGFVGLWAIERHYDPTLPSIDALRAYQPSTVTTVLASDGSTLGEIFEERRYVLELKDIPQHVQQAFVAAEDADFWEHGGIDYFGIARAMGRNLASGRVSQGGSTITQQVAKNFLLSSDRKFERKIKEALLSWRIEAAYTKEHILYLYLNEIFLGSQAYGVEAAARTFFGKSVDQLSVAEAAVIAGLPPRPSSWNPHANFKMAQTRQRYVLDRLVKNGHITAAQAAEARQEPITIVPRSNTFRDLAPWFTEEARRKLVADYGEERVLKQGITARTTCDLGLQQVAQDVVRKGVHEVDQRMGFRREGIRTLATAAEQQRHLEEQEASLIRAEQLGQDPTGRSQAPAKSTLAPGTVHDGVVTEVSSKWARVRVGSHEGLIPIAWADWAYPPDPRRSWRYRSQDDLTRAVDDGGGILRKGDLIPVRVEATSTRSADLSSTFKGTPGESADLVALRLWQVPEVEAALLSLDVSTGAIRAMVGGADFGRSQFNRTMQSKRQVGSTFKPLVYAAALNSKRITSASIVADAPLAFETDQEGFIWKPSNYGHDYMGNITLRKALALSRNTCTVRVLDSIDPGMNDDVVYEFVRALGIGGPPLHQLPDDWRTTPDTDHLCPWVRETSQSTICMDRYPPKDPELSNTAHRRQLGANDVHWCRACDLSMGLGSASLTMEELSRAYAVIANGGKWVEPYFIEEVTDRDGKRLAKHRPAEPVQVIEPEVAAITAWLMQGVVDGGTAFEAKRQLGLTMAGKTGTTNDEKDAWFVGFTPDVLTAVWVGFDQPRSLGVSSTGGRTALPIWIDYMRAAAPKDKDRPFPVWGNVSWVQIDEETGRRVSSGARSYPFLPGTVPEDSGVSAGQASLEDLTTEL